MWFSRMAAEVKTELVWLTKGILIRTMPHRFFDFQMRTKMHEPEVVLVPDLLVQGGVAVDIGANEGLWVYHFQKLASQVIAFEPVGALAGRLARKAGANVRVERVALSDAPGTAVLRFPRHWRAWGTIESANQLQRADRQVISQEVQMRTLDSYELPQVDLIKIDVEGHEFAVLEGAKATLNRCRPNLVVEIEEDHNPGAIARVRQLLEDIGYRGYFLDADAARPIEEFDPKTDQNPAHVSEKGKGGRYINNFIFRCPDRAAERPDATA